jgi:hypothetical protein
MTKLLTFKNMISLGLLLLLTFIIIYLMYPELFVAVDIKENFQANREIKLALASAWGDYMENKTTSPP